MPIRLVCVVEQRKLRIRFHSYIDSNGKVFTNVYNNEYNCQFPRDLRKEGRIFELDDDALHLCANQKPFYRVSTSNIRIIEESCPDGVAEPAQLFDVQECVICLENTPSVICLPCAHFCMCSSCFTQLPSKGDKPPCPLCRRTILQTIVK